MQTILAVDDERSILEAYRMIFDRRYRLLTASSGEEALRVLETEDPDLMLLDLMMGGISGHDVLEAIREKESPGPDVLVVTAMNSVSHAVQAMKAGARDYLIKPFDVEEIQLVIERLLEARKNRRELQRLRDAEATDVNALVGESEAFGAMLTMARRAMLVESTVLITGESGTGKDMLARAIHGGGVRADGPFVHVPCCALPDSLVESELFGHERGAFTGAHDRHVGFVQLADTGTAFLDEIGDMSSSAQARLLHVLQNAEVMPVGSARPTQVDVRFICATNRDLSGLIRDGKFREDLYYRINVVHIEVPPLRQRREDIPPLAGHFLQKYAARVGARAGTLTPDAMSTLAGYSWPGNVRELENVIQRALVLYRDEEAITREHIETIVDGGVASTFKTLQELEGLGLTEAVARIERHLIERALAQSGNVQSRAADLLGTTRRILKYKMDQLGIEQADNESSEDKQSVG